MRKDVIDRGGFDPPPYDLRRYQRTRMSLVAGLALAVGTVVAVTIVSIGIAQAGFLVAAGSGDGSLAVAFLAGCVIVGGIAGVVSRKRQQHPL
jgi:hypothetical protein